MKYFDVHVTFGDRDGDGYSIPIQLESGTEDDAIEFAKENNLFEYEEDVNNVDYVEEITKDEYNAMVNC